LAHSIIWAINHPNEANSIIVCGHKRAVSEFTSKQNAMAVFSLYEDILYR